jgi:hypothetical protein
LFAFPAKSVTGRREFFGSALTWNFAERGCARSVSRSALKNAAAGLRYSRAPFKLGDYQFFLSIAGKFCK